MRESALIIPSQDSRSEMKDAGWKPELFKLFAACCANVLLAME